MRRSALLGAGIITSAFAVGVMAPAAHGIPGGVFVTGHDPDFHAHLGGNHTGARHIIQRAIEFVTDGAASPSILYVTSRISAPSGHTDGTQSLTAAGFTFDVASAGGIAGTLDLGAVTFGSYDAVVVASDFGGILTQAELTVLNNRSADLLEYVNDGGGVVAFSESNSAARLTPQGGHFDFLPFLGSEQQLNQNESGYTVTPFGASLGLTNADVNGNASHSVFTNTGGLEAVNHDGGGRIMSLAGRGAQLCPGGVPAASVDDVVVTEPDAGEVAAVFTVTLSVSPCAGPASVSVATADGTAQAGSDYDALTVTTLTFQEGETVKQVTVPVNGDTEFEPDETFMLELATPVDLVIADDEGTGTILNDDPQNRDPDCADVAAGPPSLWPPDHKLEPVALTGASDPDGDSVALQITGVTQDEPVDGEADGNTRPDAAGAVADRVLVRAERSGKGDGRVYRIAFTGDDGNGGSCAGTATVEVPHDQSGAAAIDSGDSFDSFGL